MNKTLLCCLSATAVLLCACGKPVDPAVAKVLKERHEGFEAMGDAFKRINDGLKAGRSLDAAMTADAQKIAQYSDAIGGWFPAGSGPEASSRTEARATIWQRPDAFAEKTQTFVTEARTLAETATAGDTAAFPAQVKALGGSCKGCHDDFREED